MFAAVSGTTKLGRLGLQMLNQTLALLNAEAKGQEESQPCRTNLSL